MIYLLSYIHILQDLTFNFCHVMLKNFPFSRIVIESINSYLHTETVSIGRSSCVGYNSFKTIKIYGLWIFFKLILPMCIKIDYLLLKFTIHLPHQLNQELQ
ncbi:hypothetical protein Avbf_05557 [Armadillidium vulgare]|nr:hypothetical protein Avbf_05557 [Armadillidium vulgare]